MTTGNVDIDLGGTSTIQSMAMWNFGGASDQNVIDFDILLSDSASFPTGTTTTFGTFTANPNLGPLTAGPPEVFTSVELLTFSVE